MVILTLLIKLGCWQLSRATEKKMRLQQMSQSSSAVLHSLPQSLIDATGTLVSLSGRFETTQSLLLDNQIYQSQVGYRWFVPFRALDKKSPWILVDLGWLPAPLYRAQLPQIPILSQPLIVQGLLDMPSKPFLLHDTQVMENSFPLRIQSVNLEQLNIVSKKRFYPFILRAQTVIDPQRTSLSWPFTPQWQPVVLKAEKHYAYALQWFGLALVVLVGFLIWVKKELS